MENKDADKDADDLDLSAKFKSPTRQSLFRSCKSPLKPNPSAARSSTPRNIFHKAPTISKRCLEISGVIEKFPAIHEHFEITKKAGEGTFSKVYLAKLRSDPTQIFALKHLTPTSSPARIENELKCLQMLGGIDNVLPVRSVLRNGDHIIFILPYVPHAKFTDYMQHMTIEDIRKYMYHLFISLRHVHQLDIIHRDIKPSNFLYSKQLDSYCLIDFGLAMPVPGSNNTILNDYTNTSGSCTVPIPNNAKLSANQVKSIINNCKHAANRICDYCKGRSRQNAPRAGTPGFRSPEVLLRHPYQTTAVDMWAAGVILLSILSRRYPFFKAKDDMEALAQIITLFGSVKMKKMADSIDKDFVCVPIVEKTGDLKAVCERLSQRTCLYNSKKLNSSSESTRQTKRKRTGCADVVLADSQPKRNISSSKLLLEINAKSETEVARDTKMSRVAKRIEKRSPMKENMSSRDTQTNCSCKHCSVIPNSVYNLLERLMELDPYKRITAEEALKHPFIEDR